MAQGGMPPKAKGGRPVGARTVNQTPGVRSGPPAGPRSPRLGPPVRRTPWDAGRPQTSATAPGGGSASPATTTAATAATAATTPAEVPTAVTTLAPTAAPVGPEAPVPEGGELAGTAGERAGTAAVYGQQEQPPGVVPRQCGGRFGRKSQASADGQVQRRFRDEVKAEIGRRIVRRGHGKKHGVTGSLHRGSPWFFPEDMQKAAVPDRDVHLRTAIYLVCWEFFDRDIAAPPCPYCGSPDEVRGVPRSTVDRYFSRVQRHKVDGRAEGVQPFSTGMLDGNVLAAIRVCCMK